MRFKIIITAIMLCFLTGCSSKSSEVLLTDVTSQSATDQDSGLSEAVSQGKELLEEVEVPVSEEVPQEPERIAVFICGAVKSPGVYELLDGSRIIDAVDAAGGFSEDADRSYVNLAAKLSDGTKLKVPTQSEVVELMAGTGTGADSGVSSFPVEMAGEGDSSFATAGAPQSGLVNINTASAEQLKTLPGIGDGIAAKIIKYREENGAFKTKEDIMKVSGIKEKLFSRIKDTITV